MCQMGTSYHKEANKYWTKVRKSLTTRTPSQPSHPSSSFLSLLPSSSSSSSSPLSGLRFSTTSSSSPRTTRRAKTSCLAVAMVLLSLLLEERREKNPIGKRRKKTRGEKLCQSIYKEQSEQNKNNNNSLSLFLSLSLSTHLLLGFFAFERQSPKVTSCFGFLPSPPSLNKVMSGCCVLNTILFVPRTNTNW